MKIASGIVQSVNYEMSTIVVTIEGLEDYSIEDVQVIQKNTYGNKGINMPSVGETVLCLISQDDRTFCIGGIYSQTNNSPSSTEKISLHLKDGTFIEYDFESKNLIAEVKGEIQAKCKSFSAEAVETITVKAPKIILDGEVETTKSIEAGIDVKASGVSLTTHVHPTTAQGAPTGVPTPSGGA